MKFSGPQSFSSLVCANSGMQHASVGHAQHHSALPKKWARTREPIWRIFIELHRGRALNHTPLGEVRHLGPTPSRIDRVVANRAAADMVRGVWVGWGLGLLPMLLFGSGWALVGGILPWPGVHRSGLGSRAGAFGETFSRRRPCGGTWVPGRAACF